MIDFSNTKIRASATHKLLTEPKDKGAKDRGDLSQTAKTYLKQLYIEKLWGLDKDIRNKFCDKGKLVEGDGIAVISALDGVLYIKNEESFEDDYFTGTPDIFGFDDNGEKDFISDNKASWDAFTFIGQMNEPLDACYESQMQVYLHLTGIKKGAIDYTLVDTPEVLIQEEMRSMFYKMKGLVATEESPEYLEACQYIRLSSTYNHIPIEHRRLRFPVTYDSKFIEKAQQKVIKAREYMQQLHETHLSLNKIAVL